MDPKFSQINVQKCKYSELIMFTFNTVMRHFNITKDVRAKTVRQMQLKESKTILKMLYELLKMFYF